MGRVYTYDGQTTPATPVGDMSRSLQIDMRTFPHGRLLRTTKEINEVTGRNVPIVGRTEFRDEKRKERYVLEYPIKTMNFRPEASSFQVDTGPLLVPDFQSGADK